MNKEQYLVSLRHKSSTIPIEANMQSDGAGHILSSLGSDIAKLLKEIAQDSAGTIFVRPIAGGWLIRTYNKIYSNSGNPRERALWEDRIRKLEMNGFLEDVNGQKQDYRITQKGFEAVDQMGQT